jgi:hypothetical protein
MKKGSSLRLTFNAGKAARPQKSNFSETRVDEDVFSPRSHPLRSQFVIFNLIEREKCH